MKDGGRGTLSGAEEGVTEIPQAGPRVAENELLLAADLDARGVAPVTPPHRKGEIPVDKMLLFTVTDEGLQIDQGTLYPLLRRLESQDLLQSSWSVDEARPRRQGKERV